MKHTRYRDRKRQQPPPPKPKNWRDGWEWRSVKLALRISAAMFFCGYLAITGSMAGAWVKIKWARHYSIETGAELARTYLLERNDPEKLRYWLSVRPVEEADELMKMLEPFVPRMSGLTFIVYSDWMIQKNRMEEAAFWRQYARFRIRFDALRCGSFDALKAMAKVLDEFPRPQIHQYFAEDESRIPKSIHQVLDFDEKHPPRNDPTQFCKEITSKENELGHVLRVMRPAQEWDDLHQNLRDMTVFELRKMEFDQREKKETSPEGTPTNPPEEKKPEEKKPEKKKKPAP